MFEKHKNQKVGDDNLHVEAISNPENAAHLAALKLVMNTHLREKLELIDSEKQTKNEYIKTIINQKNMQHLWHDAIIRQQGKIVSHHETIGRGF